jgi:hypothetical protein
MSDQPPPPTPEQASDSPDEPAAAGSSTPPPSPYPPPSPDTAPSWSLPPPYVAGQPWAPGGLGATGQGVDPALDPEAATGPPWPRLVATHRGYGGYAAPRLVKWPLALGLLILVGWISLSAALVSSSPSSSTSGASSTPYVLTASDAKFTATFPARPARTARNESGTTVIDYQTSLSDHAVGVSYVGVSASTPVSLDSAVQGFANGINGTIESQQQVTYHGQPAEDAQLKIAGGGYSSVRVVRFGPSVYVMLGVGVTVDSFSADYDVLLSTFTPLS